MEDMCNIAATPANMLRCASGETPIAFIAPCVCVRVFVCAGACTRASGHNPIASIAP
jgi:hypothetical protein